MSEITAIFKPSSSLGQLAMANRLLMNDQAIGFNQDSPKEEAGNQQWDYRERDADSFLPTRSTTPRPWARWATDLIKQKETETEEDGDRDDERNGHGNLER